MRISTSIWRHCACRALVLAAFAFLIGPVMAGIFSGEAGGGAFGGRAAAQTAPAPKLSVTIRGNRRIEVETIISYMQLPVDRAITAEDLNIAVRRLFDTGLFRSRSKATMSWKTRTWRR
jgi:outer membrane protein insertion porin family